jgi:Cu/Ag efflux protein CusF
MLKSCVFVALVALVPAAGVAGAQSKSAAKAPVVKQNKVQETATITKIDQGTRSVTLRAENGDEDTFVVGPEVKRLNELKVGDTITATYYESLVFQVRKPDQPAATTGTTLAGGKLKDVPGGALAAQATTTVTVKSVDVNSGSITVTADDGRTMTRKVADKKNLEGVSPGDKIDITYSQAMMIAAAPAKK